MIRNRPQCRAGEPCEPRSWDDIAEPVNERSTRVLVIPFFDQDGEPLPDGIVASLVASLRDLGSDTLIRDAENVHGTNGGTLTAGVLTLVLDPDDSQVIGSASLQRRILTVDLVTTTGVRITEEVVYVVRALRDVS